jgi:hypothetical protein
MNERPTPETDAAEMPIDRIDTVASRPSCVVISDVARRLERERDEALLFNMRASRDASLYASMLHEKLDAERALADRLASVMFGCTARDMNDAYDAWKEARK